jgi:hypothetical protein
MRDLPLFSPTLLARSVNLSAQRTINLFPVVQQGGKNNVALYNTPGISTYATVGDGPCRGTLVYDGVAYIVSGDEFYTLVGTTAILRGTLNTSSGPVSMVTNGLQICVADGSGYVYDIAAATFAQISDTDLPGAATVTYLDGYGIFSVPDSQQFFITSLLDFTSVDALDFASAESQPDLLIRVFADHSELWLFGEKSIEVWQNTGAADFPFERLGGTRAERGCAAAFSVAKCDNTVFWLGDDGVVYRADGYQPIRISSETVELSISGMPQISDAEGFSYDIDGHKFYALSFPSGQTTWIYDVATQLWHEMQSDGEQWRAKWVFQVGMDRLCGDSSTGNIGILSLETYTEYGETINRYHVFPSINQAGAKISNPRLQIDFETGVGAVTGQGADPIAILDWSDDGGHNWSNSIDGYMGAIGTYLSRVIFNRLGSFYNRWYRVRISDPIKIAIIGLYGDFS